MFQVLYVRLSDQRQDVTNADTAIVDWIAKGAYYHLITRSVGTSADRPFGDAEKKKLVDLLHELDQFYAVEVLSYSIMSNHLHICVYAPTEKPSAKEAASRYNAYHKVLATQRSKIIKQKITPLRYAQGCIQGQRFIHRPEVVVIAGEVRDSVEMTGRRIDFAGAGGLMQNWIRRRRCECGAARQSARQRHDSGTYNTSFHSLAPFALLRNDFCSQTHVFCPPVAPTTTWNHIMSNLNSRREYKGV